MHTDKHGESPWGASPSGPMTNIYLLMQEINGQAMHVTRDFFFFRYLDNLPGILDLRLTTLEQVKAMFLDIYKMPLKLEQKGCFLDTLEMRVTIIGTFEYSVKPLLQDQIGHTIDGTIKRIPPLWCEKRSRFLNYYLPSALLKCIRYSSNFLNFMLSVENLVLGLLDHAFTLHTLIAILRHIFHVKELPMSLFYYLSHLLQLRLDLLPG